MLPSCPERKIEADCRPADGGKRCARCGKVKPGDMFYRRRGRPDGLQSWCKTCKNIYKSEYDKTPSGREARKARDEMPDRKAAIRESRKRYDSSPRRKEQRARRENSPLGKLLIRLQRLRRRERLEFAADRLAALRDQVARCEVDVARIRADLDADSFRPDTPRRRAHARYYERNRDLVNRRKRERRAAAREGRSSP